MLKVIDFIGSFIRAATIGLLGIAMYAQYSECFQLVCTDLPI